MNERKGYPRAYFRPGDFKCRHSLYLVLTEKTIDSLMDALSHALYINLCSDDDQEREEVCLAFPGDFLAKNDDSFQVIDDDVIILMP